MELNVKINLDDYQDFNKHYVLREFKSKFKGFNNLIVKYVLLFFAILIVVSIFGISDNSVIEQDASKKSYFPVSIFIALIVILCIVVAFRIGIRKSSKKYYESNALLGVEHKYLFCDDYIEISSENGYSKISWDKVYRVEVFKNYYGFFISNKEVFIIPKRIFRDFDEEKEFQNNIKWNKVGQRGSS